MNMIERPLKVAKVFLSFSFKDFECAKKIYEVLKEHFSVYFAGASEFGDYDNDVLIDSDPVEEKKIFESDIFCFIASTNSTDSSTHAYEEYRYAKNKKLSIFIIKISELPNYFSEKIYFNLPNCSVQASKLINQIKQVLYKNGGLRKVSGYNGKTIIGGQNNIQDIIIDDLIHQNYKRDYALNVVIPKPEMNLFVEKVNLLTSEDRNKVIDSLVYKYTYYHRNDLYENLRQNAITIVSKLAKGEENLIKEFSSRAPDFPNEFLFRGFHIALSQFGNDNIMNDYVYGLTKENGKEWDSQRKINIRFHIDYYGGIFQTLQKLRTSIRTQSPTYLLALNVYTLGEISKYKMDIELLLKHYKQLSNYVEEYIIQKAISNIKAKIINFK